MSHTWGDVSGIDTSVPGQVSVTGTAGFMEADSGPSQGHGYGTFTFRAKLTGNAPGPCILLWPGDGAWPGQEFDLAEIINGTAYGTTHWKATDGGDAYNSHFYDGLDESQWHTYSLRWEPGKLTYSVDGAVAGADTAHVPADYAHGGMNDVFGVMNRPGLNTSAIVSEVSWAPLS